jgi:hypothetical protein
MYNKIKFETETIDVEYNELSNYSPKSYYIGFNHLIQSGIKVFTFVPKSQVIEIDEIKRIITLSTWFYDSIKVKLMR